MGGQAADLLRKTTHLFVCQDDNCTSTLNYKDLLEHRADNPFPPLVQSQESQQDEMFGSKSETTPFEPLGEMVKSRSRLPKKRCVN